MAKTRIASVDEYIASQPETGQRVLKRVRSIIRKAVPDAQETISYGIPTYKLDGRYVLYFAGCVPVSLARNGPALGAQAGEQRLRDVFVDRGGFARFRRATETPFSIVFEARP
jgi:hypothetical protein